jgi:hypothetical protein
VVGLMGRRRAHWRTSRHFFCRTQARRVLVRSSKAGLRDFNWTGLYWTGLDCTVVSVESVLCRGERPPREQQPNGFGAWE